MVGRRVKKIERKIGKRRMNEIKSSSAFANISATYVPSYISG
jgi:hypothetical protein